MYTKATKLKRGFYFHIRNRNAFTLSFSSCRRTRKWHDSCNWKRANRKENGKFVINHIPKNVIFNKSKWMLKRKYIKRRLNHSIRLKFHFTAFLFEPVLGILWCDQKESIYVYIHLFYVSCLFVVSKTFVLNLVISYEKFSRWIWWNGVCERCRWKIFQIWRF